jgi:hypothetical protein
VATNKASPLRVDNGAFPKEKAENVYPATNGISLPTGASNSGRKPTKTMDGIARRLLAMLEDIEGAPLLQNSGAQHEHY